MERQLNGSRKAGLLWFFGALLIGFVVTGVLFFNFVGTDKDYYNPRVASNNALEFSGEQSSSASWKVEISTESAESINHEYKTTTANTIVSNGTESTRTQEDEGLSENNEKGNDIATTMEALGTNSNAQQKSGREIAQQRSPEGLLILKPLALQLPEDRAELAQLAVNLDAATSEIAKPTPLKVSKLELRFFMAPTYNMPSLEYHNTKAQTHKEFAQAIDNAVKPGWGLDAGFELRYRIYKNLRISTGFTYREIVTQNNYNFEVNEIPVIDSASGNILAYISTSQPDQRTESSSNMYTFLNIPLSLYYEKPIGRKWTLTGEVINNISFLLNQSGYGINPTTLELDKSEENFFNKTTNSYQLRLGLRYKLTENFYLALEPAYRKSYQDFISDESVSWKPQDFSLSLTGIVILK